MTLPPAVMAALRRCRWVHALGMASTCEGCANDGEPGYCDGAGIADDQDDPSELWCHCGHAVVMVELPLACECDGPNGWHCPGEESQHWAEAPRRADSSCGYCGSDPEPIDPPPSSSIPETENRALWGDR